MDRHSVALSGHFPIGLPSWGRCFWQDKNDGVLFLAYASGNFEVDFVTSADSGVTWSAPKLAFNIDNFEANPNFDVEMDRNGEVHCAFKFANSGCYAHLTKASGSWFPQGTPTERGWCIAADSGSVGGFNGSVWVQELSDTFFFDPGYTPPSYITPEIYVVAKCVGLGGITDTAIRAARVTSPYTVFPDIGRFPNDVSSITTGIVPGFDAGFPVMTDAGPIRDFGGGFGQRQRQVVYSVDGTGIVVSYADKITTRTWTFDRVIPVTDTTNDSVPPALSGLATRCPLGPTMSFGKGVLPFDLVHPIWANKTEEIVGGGLDKAWELLTTAHERELEEKTEGVGNRSVFVRVESEAEFTNIGTQPRFSGLDDIQGGAALNQIPTNVAPALAPLSGTLTDFSFGDQSGVMKFYFNARGEDGSHQVIRLLANVQAQQQGNDVLALGPIPTRYSFNFPFHPTSGIRNFAPARVSLAGGDLGKAFWKHMKACKHIPGGKWARERKELIATVGSGLTPRINNLLVWDFKDSLENEFGLKTPTFSFDHIAISGSNSSFVGLDVASIAVSPANVVNLFDGDTTTAATISNGDSVTLEWSFPVLFTRIEIPWNKTGLGSSDANNFFEVRIETSTDGVTFDEIKLYDGVAGREGFSTGDFLVKIFAEYDALSNSFFFNANMDAGVGKFLRISFTGPQTGTRDTREIRVYGASTTKGKTTTTFNDWGVTFTRPSNPPREDPENFNGVFQFSSLPPGWTASGDWSWFTQASGELSKPNFLPTAVPTSNGIIQSGVFQGQTIGSGDGSALRTSRWIPLNSSGVVEIDINVDTGEVDEDGNAGRTIKWDTRYHKIGVGVIIPAGPEDDEFNFYIAPQGTDASVNAGLIKNWHTQGPCFGSTCNYFTVKTNVAPGAHTLRWVYKRGKTRDTLPFPGDEAVAYIDNVRGLDSPPMPSVLGYLKAESFATGVIHGFMKKTKWEAVHGFIDGFFFFQHRLGYMPGGPSADSTTLGYLLPFNSEEIDGFMLGGNGLKSIPTGTIKGFVRGIPGSFSSVHGWMVNSGDFSSINAFTHGFTDVTGSIQGYAKVADAASEIFGVVNSPSGTADDTIFGILFNRVNESINAFVRAPSGTMKQILGYMAPQKVFTSLGYLAGFSDITGVINSYIKAADAESDIFGYMQSSGDFPDGSLQRVNAYLFNAGATEQVLAYLNVIHSDSIFAYMKGAEIASGCINAYTSGVGFASSEINAYLAGISGNASGSINGFMIAVEMPTSEINAYLIGFDPSDQCESHGTVPLPSLPSFTIPSGNFIN